MKGFLVFLGLALACVSAHDAGLRVKFNVGLRPGTDFFFDVPRNVIAALLQRWTVTDRVPGSRSILVLFCPADRVLCAYFDENGHVAGLQIALRQDEFTEGVYDWSVQGFSEWEPTPREGEPVLKYWVKSQFFVSEEYLQISAEERRQSYDDKKLLQEDAVWLSGFGENLDKVSNKESDIAESTYTKQACIPWMGRHYYYNMTENLPCQADSLYPWFPLVHNKELIGTGFVIFGKLPIKEGERDWFERPPKLAVQLIVPRGPECLYELASSPGLVTMHVYYINRPWSLGCLFQ
ncbi:unnamed protein product, partial [Brenthis ino]